MNTGETSDQIVRMTLQGIEVAAKYPIKGWWRNNEIISRYFICNFNGQEKSKRKGTIKILY